MTDTSSNVTPQTAVAYLLDGGEPGAIRGGPYSPPWDAIVAELAEAKPEERGGLFEAAADRLNQAAAAGLDADSGDPAPRPGDEIRAQVYAEARARFAQAATGSMDAVPPALEDEKPLLDAEFWRSIWNKGEMGKAEIVARLYGRQIIYDHADGAWYLWNGQCWEQDRVRAIVPLLSGEIRRQYYTAFTEAQDAGHKEAADDYLKDMARVGNRRYLDNVLALAATLPVLRATGDEWDHNPLLLNVANGVIELGTGTFRPGLPEDMLLARCPTEWKGIDCPAPTWERFLHEVFVRDDLAQFAQRLMGYGITGYSNEHVLPILWGGGRNGKGTLIETIAAVLGPDLACNIPSDTLMMTYSRNNAPQPFIIRLRGKRTVWASETEKARPIAASQVKYLTGGDTIVARDLHRRPIQFAPTHLLLLLTNSKPKAPEDDQALWDRILLLPFNERFIDNPIASNEHPRDKNLAAKLLKEASGILAWMVRGCMEWQRVGLNPPDTVTKASESYKKEENTIARFIEEECLNEEVCQKHEQRSLAEACLELRIDPYVRARALYTAYTNWCKDMRIYPLDDKSFFGVVMKKYEKKRMNFGYVYLGLVLRPDEKSIKRDKDLFTWAKEQDEIGKTVYGVP